MGVEPPLQLTFDIADDRAPAWSPDGNYIAFVRWSGSRQSIFLTAPVPRSERKLADFTSPVADPDLGVAIALAQVRLGWSADSRWVLTATKLDDGTNAIVAFPTGTGQRRTVLALGRGAEPRFPAVSPDGTQLAFAQCGSGTACTEICVVRLGSELAATSEPVRLTRHAPRPLTNPGNLPTWSRDGESIYFGSSRGGTRQVWRIPASGGQATQVTEQGGTMGAESDDGTTLYYSRDRALYSRPVKGGVESRVVDLVMPFAFYPAKSGIFHVVKPDPLKPSLYEIRLLSFTSAAIQTLYRFESLGGSFLLAVSPDEQTLTLDGISPTKNDDLMLIRNFR